jgi:hypothetical protein
LFVDAANFTKGELLFEYTYMILMKGIENTLRLVRRAMLMRNNEFVKIE